MKYRLDLTEAQLRVVNEALEEYFRLPLNQWHDLAERLAMKGVDFSQENPDHDKIFDRYIHTRDAVEKVFRCAGNILWPERTLYKDDEQLIAEDIWHVIRHQMYLDSGSTDTWRVGAYPPIPSGVWPLPKIEKETDNAQ